MGVAVDQDGRGDRSSSLTQPVGRDPDGDQVLALGIAAKVELIVSGDNDLLSRGSFE